MKFSNVSAVISAIVALAIILTSWGLMLIAVGIFTDLRFLAMGIIQVSSSVAVWALAWTTGFGSAPARIFATTYLFTIIVFCAIGVYSSYGYSIPAAVCFGCIGALALGCLIAFYKQQRHFAAESKS